MSPNPVIEALHIPAPGTSLLVVREDTDGFFKISRSWRVRSSSRLRRRFSSSNTRLVSTAMRFWQSQIPRAARTWAASAGRELDLDQARMVLAVDCGPAAAGFPFWAGRSLVFPIKHKRYFHQCQMEPEPAIGYQWALDQAPQCQGVADC